MTRGNLCPGGSLSVQGISVHGGLCSRRSLSGWSVQGGSLLGRSLSRRRGSLSRRVSVQGGSLSGRSLSRRRRSLSKGSLSRGFSVQWEWGLYPGGSLSKRSLSRGLCPVGLCLGSLCPGGLSKGSLSRGSLSRSRVSVQGSLPTETRQRPDRDPLSSSHRSPPVPVDRWTLLKILPCNKLRQRTIGINRTKLNLVKTQSINPLR